MAANPSSNSKTPAAENVGGAQPALTFEEKLHQFWQTNRAAVLGLCALVLLVVIGKGWWEISQRRKERQIESAYAAATTPEQLSAFAAEHPSHELAAIAELRIADEAYSNGKAADALAGYEKACAILKDGPLATRAQLGRALAAIQAGKTSEGTEALKKITNDATALNASRAQAAYQLAALAADAGNGDEARKYIEQVNQIDPASSWARRGMMLQASLPIAVGPAAAPATPAATPSATPAAAKDAAAPSVKLNLPKK